MSNEPKQLKPGALYRIRGGHYMRYQGGEVGRSYDGKPVYRFDAPAYPIEDPPCGGKYFAEADILGEITLEDLPMLHTRVAQARARGLVDAAETAELIIAELTGIGASR